MQTLHLWLQALRAISLGQRPGRWPSPSMRSASTWKGAPPLPNHPRPTRTVGTASDAPRAGMKGPPGLSNSPGPTSAVGSHPAVSHQRLARCPMVGAGLSLASPLREPRVAEPDDASTSRVCPRQTASRGLLRYPVPHEAGDVGPSLWQARVSELRYSPSSEPSASLPPQRGHRASGAGACSFREQTVARHPDGSGPRCSEAPGLRPTGRLNPMLTTRETGPGSPLFCDRTPALVTSQRPIGVRVPGPMWPSCLRRRAY